MPIKPYLANEEVRFDLTQPATHLPKLAHDMYGPESVQDVFSVEEPYVSWAATQVRDSGSALSQLISMVGPKDLLHSSVVQKMVELRFDARVLLNPLYSIDVVTFLALISKPESYFCQKSEQTVLVVRCISETSKVVAYRIVWSDQGKKFILFRLLFNDKVETGICKSSCLILPASAI